MMHRRFEPRILCACDSLAAFRLVETVDHNKSCTVLVVEEPISSEDAMGHFVLRYEPVQMDIFAMKVIGVAMEWTSRPLLYCGEYWAEMPERER